jgi:hypothetical protein
MTKPRKRPRDLCVPRTPSLLIKRSNRRLCVPNVWPAPDLQVDFYDLVSISLQ